MMLDVRNLTIDLPRPGEGATRAVDGLSFHLDRGETLGVVGESGSGKSMLALALIGLLPGMARTRGQIFLDGQDLLTLSERALCNIRGGRIGLIFQELMTALNPAMRVGEQIAEGLRLGAGIPREAARAESLRLLQRVRIPEAARRFGAYPHELSGGQRQRIGIAIALARKPALLVADEPTTALDTTVQKDILDLIDEIALECGMGLILISHDIGVIARMADRVMVMSAGRMMEQGSVEAVLRHPGAEVTKGLIAALPARTRAGLSTP